MTAPVIDETHDPALVSWVQSAGGHPQFPIQNLPFGCFAPPAGRPRPGIAIGDCILDLPGCAEAGLLPAEASASLTAETLGPLFALPADVLRALRGTLSTLLVQPSYRSAVEPLLFPAVGCRLFVPAPIGDFTDFYAGIHHARNVGRLMRPDAPLPQNYKHLPIGYHGRASSVRLTGEPVKRPSGQRQSASADVPEFGPTQRLDFELELGVWIGHGNPSGVSIGIDRALAHAAGLCLLNDWSARDIQAWEYQPLGPFLGKSFHTTISAWVVTLDALAPFRRAQASRPAGDPAPLPYLWHPDDQRHGAFDIELEVHLTSLRMRRRGLEPYRLARTHASHLYWTAAQLIAHHSSNGCNLKTGDLLGTGTISSAEPAGFGSLIELTQGGAEPLSLPGGEFRAYLEDGDEVLLSATARRSGYAPIGFGPCRALILAGG